MVAEAVAPSQALVVSDAHAFYPGGIHALKGVSLSIDVGEIVALIGSNGAGKSTLLNVISGIVRARSGRVQFMGEDIAQVPAHEIVGKGISQVPEGRRVFAPLTVRENLILGAYGHPGSWVSQALGSVLELFPRLRERLNQLAGTLSGGEQQMLAVGRALMAKPKLLLLDEPSLGLSPVLVQQIFATVRQINDQGTSILIVEQNARAALRLAHRAYVLDSGDIVLSGLASELLNDPRVHSAYLGGSVHRAPSSADPHPRTGEA